MHFKSITSLVAKAPLFFRFGEFRVSKSSKVHGSELHQFNQSLQMSAELMSSIEKKNQKKIQCKYSSDNNIKKLKVDLRQSNEQQFKNLENKSAVMILYQEVKQKILSIQLTKNERIQQAIQQQKLKNTNCFLDKGSQSQKTIDRAKSSFVSSFQKNNTQQTLQGTNEKQLIQRQSFLKKLKFNQNYRCMVMIRLEILWNQKIQELNIDQLILLIEKLSDSQEFEHNELKPMMLLFLAVEALKMCVKHPRVYRNIFCSTKSILQNIQSLKNSVLGELKVKLDFFKVENMLMQLYKYIEKNSTEQIFMNAQVQAQYLMEEILISFRRPNLYNDKQQCLQSSPPRVFFQEPFNQQYDRLIEMAVLIFFNKKLQKQSKLSRLENINLIFEQLKNYEQVKLEESYQKSNRCERQIKKHKKKANQINKRERVMKWMCCYTKKLQIQ